MHILYIYIIKFLDKTVFLKNGEIKTDFFVQSIDTHKILSYFVHIPIIVQKNISL